jgi:hypothetical protein
MKREFYGISQNSNDEDNDNNDDIAISKKYIQYITIGNGIGYLLFLLFLFVQHIILYDIIQIKKKERLF